MASDLEAVERLVESDDKATKALPQYGADDPMWTTAEFVEIRHPYATPHVPVQPLSTVS